MSSKPNQIRKKPVLKHSLLVPEKKTDNRYEPMQIKGLQDVEDYNAFKERRYQEYRRTGGTASKEQFERSRKQRSRVKPPVPLFGQPPPQEPKINKQTSAYGSSMNSPAGAQTSQKTFITGISPHPAFTQPGSFHSGSQDNTWGKAESDLLISQIASWDDNGEPWKFSEEEDHNSIEGADIIDGHEKWQRDIEKNGSSVKPGTKNVEWSYSSRGWEETRNRR
ncbi:uncharacterized protein EAF02_009741 [Botrytis sinoallii]|uniref:uncharacterized protein n=1 Tax=Botrytis sinoallii TaxID=1463999 RepID=UPI001900BA12|nr:uncharacterized protein EAF02_009741 [Botrytis sinoallii]KAF7867550.1 hypothetical protein EAF02_009741 [Botrytis sinoallii]